MCMYNMTIYNYVCHFPAEGRRFRQSTPTPNKITTTTTTYASFTSTKQYSVLIVLGALRLCALPLYLRANSQYSLNENPQMHARVICRLYLSVQVIIQYNFWRCVYHLDKPRGLRNQDTERIRWIRFVPYIKMCSRIRSINKVGLIVKNISFKNGKVCR